MNEHIINKELDSISYKCTDAFNKKDTLLLKKLSKECELKSEEESMPLLAKFNYLYYSFTALSDAISIDIKSSLGVDNALPKSQLIKKYEDDYKYCFYLARLIYNIIKKDTGNYNTKKEKDNFDVLYSIFLINYSSLLHKNGRLISSIDLLSKFLDERNPFTMGKVSLADLLYDYAHVYYDQGHQLILFQYSYRLTIKALESIDYIQDNENPKRILIDLKNKLEALLDKDTLLENKPITDSIIPDNEMSDIENKYRGWISKNKLSLNILNDIYTDIVIAYDPMLLPHMYGDIKVKDHIGLFNQIKQEYVSSRFLLYEGISDDRDHFSNKYVKLIDTLNYPIYNLNTEKLKLSYRSCYSILDKVAYFLNEYFELEIDQNTVNFDKIWNPDKTKKDKTKKDKTNKDKTKLLDIAGENSYLLGIYWIYKDLRSRYNNDYKKSVTKEYKQIVDIRNALEHKYLKVNEDFSDPINNEWTDKLAYNITLSDLKDVTTLCFKLVREVIILLVLAINCNEHNNKNIHGRDVDTISLSEYKC